jgi:hypothetical protein
MRRGQTPKTSLPADAVLKNGKLLLKILEEQVTMMSTTRKHRIIEPSIARMAQIGEGS